MPFGCVAACFVLSFLLSKALRMERRRQGVFIVMCSLSNSMFIGYAMCTELFGEACVPYVMLFYLASTSFTQTLAMYLIRRSGERPDGAPRRSPFAFLLSPTVLAVFTGFALVLLDLNPPSFVMSYLRYMNGVVTPLALLLTGYIIYEMGWDKLKPDRDLVIALGFRFLAAPALFFLGCLLLGVEGLARDTFLAEAAMPVVTQTVVASAQYGADERFAAGGAALSTLASFLVIPVLMVLLQ